MTPRETPREMEAWDDTYLGRPEGKKIPLARRACGCAVPEPVQQADGKFYCHACSFETGARPSFLEPETTIAQLRDQLATARQEKEKAEHWADLCTRGKSPCGHWKAYAVTEDGGKHITCLACDLSEAREALRECEFQLQLREAEERGDSRT